MKGLTFRTQKDIITLYGEYYIHHNQPFQKYTDLSMVSAYVFFLLTKLHMSTFLGFRLEAEEN